MHDIEFRLNGDGGAVEVIGIDAVKVAQLQGADAQRLSDLILHRWDLAFARDCLDELTDGKATTTLVQRALWQAAIVSYMKCFGGSRARGQLKRTIYDAGLPRTIFDQFRALRNKHIAHDDNAYAQAIPAAIIAPAGAALKVPVVTTLRATAQTLDQPSFGNLHLLVGIALEHVTTKYDETAQRLCDQLEQLPYDELLALPSASYRAPTSQDLSKTRDPH